MLCVYSITLGQILKPLEGSDIYNANHGQNMNDMKVLTQTGQQVTHLHLISNTTLTSLLTDVKQYYHDLYGLEL